ncbi:hypothetical protein XANCAGTX0491_006740 [Xanthoria calcicola]
MQYAVGRLWLIYSITNLLLTTVSHALPRPNLPTQPVHRNTKRNFLLRRDDEEGFLGGDWEVAVMENHAAYVPHQEAAAALADFYTSLRTIAQFPLTLPNHWLVHRIGRVMIIFHSSSIVIPWELIVRFAEGMLNFTHLGYTCSYLMVFRHVLLGYTITVTLAILDHDPGDEGPGSCVLEEHGQINSSGIQQHQICLRPPSFPGSGQGPGGSGSGSGTGV